MKIDHDNGDDTAQFHIAHIAELDQVIGYLSNLRSEHELALLDLSDKPIGRLSQWEERERVNDRKAKRKVRS